jgi:NADPH:quinone reductase-like Zn-dependent oxidoreductase
MAEMTGIQVQLVKQGGPFEIVQSPKPIPASDEVVVKLRAVALNPLDWKQMSFLIKSCKI